MIVTICGSARFKEEISKAQLDLALKGHLVFTVEDMQDTVITKEIEDTLANSHKKKIDLSDAIYVVNVDGYIGESTRNEIDYALKNGKMILYLEK